ncbi:putative 3-phosphoinositide-dependent protein kinase 1 [Blattamonas nauphoetae]|uniref:non-specific serine/threonine protein kinase n=1 Tax=Blattamonas nauphoetae TaxID=2049346 RepID=A0ABQ9WWM5_9EUKA|nr:putative 3-phosphoinositide-dependent protein kinase 1 [Blattamonas nauphoetae]
MIVKLGVVYRDRPLSERDVDKGWKLNSKTNHLKLKKLFPTDFNFEETIGFGSFSSVFKAVNKKTGKLVAIKQISKSHIIKNKMEKTVYTERDVLRKYPHPLILHFYGNYQDNESLYFVLELCKTDMSKYVSQKALHIEVARFFTAELLQALEHLHTNGVVHRDLKPENIFLATDGHIRVADFGSALIRGSEQEKEEMGNKKGREMVGTPLYVSPEVIKNEMATEQSDLWAFGLILFYLIAGHPLFSGATQFLLFNHILKANYTIPPGFDETAADLVRKLVVLNPSDRLTINQIKQHPFFTTSTIPWDTIHLTNPPIHTQTSSSKRVANNRIHITESNHETDSKSSRSLARTPSQFSPRNSELDISKPHQQSHSRLDHLNNHSIRPNVGPHSTTHNFGSIWKEELSPRTQTSPEFSASEDHLLSSITGRVLPKSNFFPLPPKALQIIKTSQPLSVPVAEETRKASPPTQRRSPRVTPRKLFRHRTSPSGSFDGDRSFDGGHPTDGGRSENPVSVPPASSSTTRWRKTLDAGVVKAMLETMRPPDPAKNTPLLATTPPSEPDFGIHDSPAHSLKLLPSAEQILFSRGRKDVSDDPLLHIEGDVCSIEDDSFDTTRLDIHHAAEDGMAEGNLLYDAFVSQNRFSPIHSADFSLTRSLSFSRMTYNTTETTRTAASDEDELPLWKGVYKLESASGSVVQQLGTLSETTSTAGNTFEELMSETPSTTDCTATELMSEKRTPSPSRESSIEEDDEDSVLMKKEWDNDDDDVSANSSSNDGSVSSFFSISSLCPVDKADAPSKHHTRNAAERRLSVLMDVSWNDLYTSLASLLSLNSSATLEDLTINTSSDHSEDENEHDETTDEWLTLMSSNTSTRLFEQTTLADTSPQTRMIPPFLMSVSSSVLSRSITNTRMESAAVSHPPNTPQPQTAASSSHLPAGLLVQESPFDPSSFLLSNERTIRTSIVWLWAKKQKKTRHLILTDTPRLLFVNPMTLTVTGEVIWGAKVWAEAIDATRFAIHTKQRILLLDDILNHAATGWVEEINRQTVAFTHNSFSGAHERNPSHTPNTSQSTMIS